MRKLASWIDRFIEATEHTASPTIFRRWTAIFTIASVLEQKVWITTSEPLYPNLYIMLVAPPGIGKSRAIRKGYQLISAMPDPHIAPTSINAASIIDHLNECKRSIIAQPSFEYNSMAIMVSEFGTFMSEYENGLMSILTDFYNVTPYGQRRRGNNQLKIKIERPQLNMLIGATPDAIAKFMPEGAWGQGFASRIIFVYSGEKIRIDDFGGIPSDDLPQELYDDLKQINSCIGKFTVTEDYRNSVNLWRDANEELPSIPKPNHPKLTHYNTRRREILYRLSMTSALDRSNALVLMKEDFNRAMGWLLEAEQYMPQAFDLSNARSDDSAIEEIYHVIKSRNGRVMSEPELIREVSRRVPAYAVYKLIDVMERSGMIQTATRNRHGARTFKIGTIN